MILLFNTLTESAMIYTRTYGIFYRCVHSVYAAITHSQVVKYVTMIQFEIEDGAGCRDDAIERDRTQKLWRVRIRFGALYTELSLEGRTVAKGKRNRAH